MFDVNIVIFFLLLLMSLRTLALETFNNARCVLTPGISNIRCYSCHYTYNENAHSPIPDDGKEPSCIPTPESVQKSGYLQHVNELTPYIATTIQCPHPDHKFCQVSRNVLHKGLKCSFERVSWTLNA